MTDIGRRKFLGVAAVAPVTAGSLFKQSVEKIGMRLGDSYHPDYGSEDEKPVKFFDFIKFALKQEANWRRSAENVDCLDPDIASLHIALQYAYIMQRERNYQRIKARSKWRFDERIAKQGFFSAYM